MVKILCVLPEQLKVTQNGREYRKYILPLGSITQSNTSPVPARFLITLSKSSYRYQSMVHSHQQLLELWPHSKNFLNHFTCSNTRSMLKDTLHVTEHPECTAKNSLLQSLPSSSHISLAQQFDSQGEWYTDLWRCSITKIIMVWASGNKINLSTFRFFELVLPRLACLST